jgi:hypothetical protein
MGILETGAGPDPVGRAGGTSEACGFEDGAVGVRDSHAAKATAVIAAARYLIILISPAANMERPGARVFDNS